MTCRPERQRNKQTQKGITMNSEMALLCEWSDGFTFSLNESSTGKNGVMKFRGKFQEAETINKNKRSYPKEVLDENVSLSEAGAVNGSTFLLHYRHRRPVR